MRIATWNVNSLRVRLPHVLAWLKENPVDVLALQETKLTDDKFPAGEIAGSGYRALFHGQPTYNGVAILSRAAPETPVHGIPGFEDEQKRVLTATADNARIICVYVPNGGDLDSPKYGYKLEWLQRLKAFVAAEIERHGNVVVLGDFNVAPRPEDTHDPEKWEGRILCSELERAGLRALLETGLEDTWRRFPEREKRQRFTWWDYRGMGWRRNAGLRIDHILASTNLASACTSCEVDTTPRRWERPSDHAPVTAEFKGH
jgi:exodeoxyribonuclease-3